MRLSVHSVRSHNTIFDFHTFYINQFEQINVYTDILEIRSFLHFTAVCITSKLIFFFAYSVTVTYCVINLSIIFLSKQKIPSGNVE